MRSLWQCFYVEKENPVRLNFISSTSGSCGVWVISRDEARMFTENGLGQGLSNGSKVKDPSEQRKLMQSLKILVVDS